MIIGVLVEISAKMVDKVFDYNVPVELQSKIKIGIRVSVPFGRMTLEGFVLEIKKESSLSDLKSIIDVVDSEIVLNDELLELGKVMRNNTLSTLINCYQVMLPKALKAKNKGNINIKYNIFYKLNPNYDKTIKFNDKQNKIIGLVSNRLVSRKELVDISSSSLNTLIKKNVLLEEKKNIIELIIKNQKL